MNRLAIVLCLLAGLALSICWLWHVKPSPQLETGPAPQPMSLAEQLNQIIIPDYSIEGITLEEAVEQLRLKIREFGISLAGYSSKGVNIVIIAGGDRKLPSTSSLMLRDVPLAEALRHIIGLVDLKYTVERHAVAIREIQDLRTPVYLKTTGLHHRMEKIIRPTVQFQDATIHEALEYLRVSRGCLDITEGDKSAPPLNYVLHLREGVKRTPISLDLRDIPMSEALRYCAEISDAKLRYDPFAVVVTNSETGGSSDGLPATSSQIILPAIDLTGATLAESLEIIRLKSRELNPDHSEVRIVVRPGSSSPSMNLWLENIPINEALRYIADLSDCTLSFDGRSYVLTPRSGR